MHVLIIVIISIILIFAYVAIVLVPKHKATVPEKYIITKVEMLILNGENDKAIEMLESYLERYPNHEKALYLLKQAKKM